MDPEWMSMIAQYEMPFGKYKGVRMIDIPEEYFIWFQHKGLPEGKLGEIMIAVYDIKVNGLEKLFDPFR